jgi:hypothetical protein
MYSSCQHADAVCNAAAAAAAQVMEVRQLRGRLAAAERQLMAVRGGSPGPGQTAAAGVDMQRFQVCCTSRWLNSKPAAQAVFNLGSCKH